MSSADKLYNAQSILKDYRVLGESVWERFQGRKEGTLWYYRALVDAFRKTETTVIIEELERVVAQIEVLASQ